LDIPDLVVRGGKRNQQRGHEQKKDPFHGID
jgi:hypothetical protein